MGRLRQSASTAAAGVAEASGAIDAACDSVAELVGAIHAHGLVIGIAVNPDAGKKIVEKFGVTIRIGKP